MSKSFLSLILLVVASFSLVGCATDSGSNGAWGPGGAGRRGMIGAGGGAAAGAIIGGGRGAGAGAIIGGLVGAGTAR
jgi:hypothetical protein